MSAIGAGFFRILLHRTTLGCQLYTCDMLPLCAVWKRENFVKLYTGATNIEIINNTRGGIEGEIWERGDWGANSSPVCSLIHDVRLVFLLFKLFFAVKILHISFQIV